MEIIFKIHSLVLLYTEKRLSEFHKFSWQIYGCIHSYRKENIILSLLLELRNQCLMWILSSGSPKAYLKACIQGVELEGNINSSCQVECSQENLFTMDLISTILLTGCTKYCTLLFPVPQYCIICPSTGTRLELRIFVCLHIKALAGAH